VVLFYYNDSLPRLRDLQIFTASASANLACPSQRHTLLCNNIKK
jgi:hypothetical protein